jgi:hypothetical protein
LNNDDSLRIGIFGGECPLQWLHIFIATMAGRLPGFPKAMMGLGKGDTMGEN